MKPQLQKQDSNLHNIVKKEDRNSKLEENKNFFYFLRLWAFGEYAADAWLQRKTFGEDGVESDLYTKTFEEKDKKVHTKKISNSNIENEDAEEHKKNLERQRVEKEIDRILEENDYIFFLKAIQNGYTATPYQNKKFSERVDTCIKYGQLSSIEQYLQLGYTLPWEKLVNLFFSGDKDKENKDLFALMDVAFRGNNVKAVVYPINEKAQMQSVFDKRTKEDTQYEEHERGLQQRMLKRLSGLSEKQKEICMKNYGETLLFKAIQDFANNPETIPLLAKELIKRSEGEEHDDCNLIMALYKFNDLLFPHMSRDEYLKLSNNIFHYRYDTGNYYCRWDMSGYMKQSVDIFYPDHHVNLMNDIKNIYVEKKIDNITATIKKEETKKYTVKNLPHDAHNIVEKIEKHYQQLKHASLSVEDNTELELTIEKRIPQLLHKYFSIHEEYRETLVNPQGKNALQLLVESLDNLENNLSEMMNRYQEQKLHDLTVDHRYTTNIRKPSM